MGASSEDILRLRQEMDEAHKNRQQLIREIHADVQANSRQSRQFAKVGQSCRAKFAAVIEDLRNKIQQQADETREQLAKLVGNLGHLGNIFRLRQEAVSESENLVWASGDGAQQRPGLTDTQ